MHTIKIEKYKGIIPSAWDELNRKQLFTIIRLFKRSKTLTKFNLLTILNFLNIRIYPKSPILKKNKQLFKIWFKRKIYFVSNIALTDLSNIAEFLTKAITNEEGKQKIILNSKLTINLIPHFRYILRKYYGPDNKLFNITFDEFLEAITHYTDYTKTGNKAELNKLIATLYRQKDKNCNINSIDYKGDRRQLFNSTLIDRHARHFKHLNITTKLAIFLFFEGCIHFLDINFPHVFSKGTKKSLNNYGALSLIDALSSGDVTKNETIRKTLLYDVMVRFENAALENDKILNQK